MFYRALFVVFLLPSLASAGGPTPVPAYLLELPATVEMILIAETDTSTLYQFGNGPDGLERRGESYMSVGLKGVGKERAWDRKTPLGIYFVNEQLDTSGLHEKYGPTAFPLDYPNIWDRVNRRSGDGIWIHGVAPNGGRRPALDTDGCIALPNDELLALAEHLEPLVTPVLIARTIRWADDGEVAAAKTELRASLASWTTSWERGDIHRFLSLYAEDFTYRGMTRDDWNAFRTQSISNAPAKQVELRDVLLLVDPDDDGLYLSRFEQHIVYKDRKVVTVKRLYWRRGPDGKLRIVAEDNG